MQIGIPKELKNQEFRVGATPSAVSLFTQHGHTVVVQTNAGARIGYSDELYIQAGARIVESLEEVYESEMIVKVKEPQALEYPLLKEGQILYCYLHLAPDPEQTKHLVKSKAVAIAYETITDEHNRLPLLTPMSEIAGRVAIQAGATALQMVHGGRGVLLGGIPGVKPGKVLVLGGGIVGTESLRMALGLGADVTVLDRSMKRLRQLDKHYAPALKTRYSTAVAVEEELKEADLVIGAVLIPGKSAPRLITEEMLKIMKKGSVIVDVAIDQGGCTEISRPTTHEDPIYDVHGISLYCVSNMPAACARTATEGLTNVTIPFALKIADQGYQRALREDPHLKNGLNVCLGCVTYRHVAEDLGYEYVPADQALGLPRKKKREIAKAFS